MKILIIIFSLLMLQTCSNATNKEKNEVNQAIENKISGTSSFENKNGNDEIKIIKSTINKKELSIVKDTVLNNIQKKIVDASYDGFSKRNTEKLDKIESFLENSYIDNDNQKNYWIAYVNYYKTIIATQLNNKDLGYRFNKKGIESLEKNKNKNSDDYALLALSKGLSYYFALGMEAISISKDINKLLEKAIKADNENFRVYYAQASIDFYTPKEYGGGKKVESSLLKAIKLPEKNLKNSQLPTWGKEESYDLIIRFYLRERDKKKALTYFNQAKQLYPNSYVIKKYQSSFNPL